jgi:hypothetical protein
VPYAFAHPAAVIPVAKIFGRRAVPSALAIGSMIPDVWYFVPWLDREQTHGVLAVWLCLPAGLAVYAAFHLIFKQPMLALSPRKLAGRLAALTPPGLPAAPWLSVLLSLLAGIATHLAWDAFTHAGYVPFVETRLAEGVHLHRVLQHASTLLGTAFLAWWAWRVLRATPPKPGVRELHGRLRMAVVAVMVILPAMAFFGAWQALDGEALRIALRAAGVTALSAFGLVALFFSLAWRRGLI